MRSLPWEMVSLPTDFRIHNLEFDYSISKSYFHQKEIFYVGVVFFNTFLVLLTGKPTNIFPFLYCFLLLGVFFFFIIHAFFYLNHFTPYRYPLNYERICSSKFHRLSLQFGLKTDFSLIFSWVFRRFVVNTTYVSFMKFYFIY